MVFFGLDQIITYISLVLVSFLGLPIGLALAGFAPDEAHKYRNLFIPLQMIFLILFFTIAIIYLPLFVSSAIILLSFGFLYLFWHKMSHNVLDYIVFSVVLVLFSFSASAMLYATIVLFLFGLVSGFLFYVLHTKDPISKKQSHVAVHKHSGKHLPFEKIFSKLIRKYTYIPILALIVFITSNLAYFFMV